MVTENKMIDNCLYRGVSLELHNKNNGVLKPKGTSFKLVFSLDTGFVRLDSGAILGESTENAVIGHQFDSNDFPTSGVSTTLHFERARIYATHDSKEGIIYKIDRNRLKNNDVSEFIVKDFVKSPKIPDDEEVILNHKDHGVLPDKIIVAVIPVKL